ncbi:AcrB/AcrD/AcrF family protein [bacterium]|nr:AcrB/AcrD/AcrF family protein [bacterium]
MRGMMTWFAENHVAANLLMLVIVVSGLVAILTITQEVFPETDLDMITASVVFLGGTPSEVEEGICIKIEEAVQGVDGIKKITSTASEGIGTVTIELDSGTDKQKAYDDVKSEIDRIITFPENTEKPVVTLVEARRPVMDIIVYGDTDERSLKVLADRVRDDLMTTAGITYAEVAGTRPYEISIEVSEAALRAHGLTLGAVAQAVRTNSLDLPGGKVKTEGGEILVRTKGQRYTGEQFADIVAISTPDGSRVMLSELATIRDGFEDVDLRTRMDGMPAALVSVYRSGDENVLDVASAVKGYVAEQREALPEGISLAIWRDRSSIYRDRMNLLLKNGLLGLALVFGVLAATMQFRLAFWVALGIGISFLGAFWVLPWFGVTLNMISLFAFILSLGIVVDDAIVVGENIFARRERGEDPQTAARRGVLEVGGPVTFAVLTTVAAFSPLLNVEGMMGKFMQPMAVVVIAVLLFSLVESLLILPAHLTTVKKVRLQGSTVPENLRDRPGMAGWFHRSKHLVSERLEWFVDAVYRKHLAWSLNNRVIVMAIATAIMLITLGWAGAGHIKFTFMPKIESDTVTAALTLPQGTTMQDATEAAERLEASLESVREELRAELSEQTPAQVIAVQTTIGEQPRASGGAGPMASNTGGSGAHLLEVSAELLPGDERTVKATDVARRWREATGPIPEAVELSFASDLFSAGKPIQIQLASPITGDLVAAAQDLKDELATYPGVTDISDSFREGKVELKLDLKPEARTLGLSLRDLADQVRRGFYGAEVMRIQRGRDEVKVMVRYPERERTSLAFVEDMRVRTPQGAEVPFTRVARMEIGRGYASIDRADRQRIVNVFGDVDQEKANASEVIASLEAGALPELLARYPGLSYDLEGQEREMAESMRSLGIGFALAVFVIYSLLAVVFRSYLQPLLVMSAIPYGIVGAVWGHVLMGWDLTLLSMFGVVALAGVVVNDSLLMIDFINRARRLGLPVQQAILDSGVRRFRPIILTSVTTFLGLTPLLLETSLQAQFLIPMAISLGFGVLFATGITLLLVPVGYSLLVSAKRYFGLRDEVYVAESDLEESRSGGDYGQAPTAP